ncbi:hypothetical protein M422DRAFT_36813, partial [Sphaerobolus stellatus SS14]
HMISNKTSHRVHTASYPIHPIPISLSTVPATSPQINRGNAPEPDIAGHILSN